MSQLEPQTDPQAAKGLPPGMMNANAQGGPIDTGLNLVDLNDDSPARELTTDQLQAIALLLGGSTCREAGAALGLHWATVSRWQASLEPFREEYERQRLLLYSSDLQYARTRLREHLDAPEVKHQQGSAKILLEHHAQMARANSTVTHTVILDKLQAALQGKDADAIDAEYRAIAEGEDVACLPNASEDAQGED